MDNDRFATVGVRIGAAIIDGILAIAVWGVLFVIFSPGTTGSGALFFSVVLNIVFFVAFVFLISSYGATPGKLVLGLRITAEDGQTSPIERGVAAKRMAVNFVSIIPIVGILASLAVAVMSLVYVAKDFERRSVYDRIGGTRVVYANRL